MLFITCSGEEGAVEVPGTQAFFDLHSTWDQTGTFYNFPYPSDLRMSAAKGPDLQGMPLNANSDIAASIHKLAQDRKGFPVVPVAFFKFTAPLKQRKPTDLIAARASSPVILVDIDPLSPEQGKLYPTVAITLKKDDYAPQNLLAVAPRPGIVLAAGRTYAFALLRSLEDAQGQLLGIPLALNQLKDDILPSGPRAAAARQLYSGLWQRLADAGVDLDQVAAATVFSTGDVVAETAKLASAVATKHPVTITGLKLDPDDGDHPRYCELIGKVSYPQFQRGIAPFSKEGLFDFDATGLPKKQRVEEANVVITLPKASMPTGGYRLMVYVHGSGGKSSQVVDRGRVTVKGGTPTKGEGPAHVVAPLGIAAASSSMPLNPERYPGAGDYDYLNILNPSAFRDTFRQGLMEGVMFIEALRKLKIPASALGSCKGPALPAGATAFSFSLDRLAMMGQSMGAMYTNLIGSVVKDVGAVVPTGAGGFWTYFMFRSQRIPGSAIGLAFGTYEKTSFLHPAIHMLQTAWEAADPIAYTSRVASRPLPGHPARHIYQPVGQGDSYFNTEVLDVMALSYGNEMAGKEVWTTMQQALALSGLSGIINYPVKNNLTSLKDNKPYTGVVVQYQGDGIYDPHAIAFQLDSVMHQYSCFLNSYFQTGTAVVPAPAALGSACP